MAARRRWIDKFGGIVRINDDHPLAIAQDMADAEDGDDLSPERIEAEIAAGLREAPEEPDSEEDGEEGGDEKPKAKKKGQAKKKSAEE